MTDSSPSQTRFAFSSSVDPNRTAAQLRNAEGKRQDSPFGSPTSTISSTSSRLPLRTNPTTSTIGTPNRKIKIRSDPTLLTCFDPADKELYDLWAPKQ